MNIELSKSIKVTSIFMALCMVLYHNVISPAVSSPASCVLPFAYVSSIINNMTSVAMCYFFQTTGFFMYFNSDSNNIISRIEKRITSLLLPFFLWNFIAFFVFHKRITSVKDLLWHVSIEPYNGPTWYLLSIFIFACFSPFIMCIFQKNKSLLFSILASLFIVFDFIANFYTQSINDLLSYGWYITRLASYIPNYILGMLLGLYFSDITIYFQKIIPFTKFTFLPVLFFIPMLIKGFPSLYKYVVPILFVLLFYSTHIFNSRLCLFFADCSFLIYCSHSIFLFYYQHIISVLFPNPNILTSLVCRLVAPFILLIVVATIKYIASKLNILNKLFLILSGGR